MRIATLVARIVMGIAFVIFGANGFVHFIPQPTLPPDLTRDYFAVMTMSHYFVLPFVLQLVAGVLFLVDRYVALALAIIAPVIVNILLFHLLLSPATIAPAIVVTICWFVVFAAKRGSFAALGDSSGAWNARATPSS